MARRRRPARTSPSWSSTTMLSEVSQASLSSPVAPSLAARANASNVFSGAWARAPRWAKVIGRGRRDSTCGPYPSSGRAAAGHPVRALELDEGLHAAGDLHHEGRALAERALAADAATQRLHDPTGHVEPKPHATLAAGRGVVDLAELLEQGRQVAGVDAGPTIPDR